MVASVDAVIAGIPKLAGRSDLTITPLTGGLTNHNFRVDVGGESFVLRIGGANSDLLGINRNQEYAANMAAARAALAPEVVAFNPGAGYMVTRFIRGGAVPQDAMHRPEMIRRIVVDVLDKLHALPPIEGQFSVFRRVETMRDTAERMGIRLPEGFEWIMARVHDMEDALSRNPSSPCLCHNDLGRRNFLDDGRIRLIDWEYAGMGDPFFDLANFCANQSFKEEQEHAVLGYYFGRVTRGRTARLKLMRLMSDVHEMMWCLIQSRISQLNTDYRGFAETNAMFLNDRLRDPSWAQWLMLVDKDT